MSGLPSKKDFLKSPLVMANGFPKIIGFQKWPLDSSTNRQTRQKNMFAKKI